jgi:hypothetical protein
MLDDFDGDILGHYMIDLAGDSPLFACDAGAVRPISPLVR